VSTPSSSRRLLHARAVVLGALALGCVFLTQCGDEETTSPTGSIDSNIRTLSRLDQPAPFSERPIGDPVVDTYVRDGRTYECSARDYEVAAGFDQQLSLNPTTDVIWPGGIVDGATIQTGEYTPIVADRAPLTISISLEHIAGDKSRTIENPSLSSIRNAIGEILAQEVTGATAAYVTFEIEQIHSESQLDIALGATYRKGMATVKNQFDFSNEEALTRILVKFIQVYYSIDVDVPQKPSDLFDSSVKWSDLDGQISGNVSPMYVSSIKYGRMALFSFESKYSFTQIKEALDATYESVKEGGSGDLDFEYKNRLQQTTIKGTIIGGSGASAVGVVNGFEGLKTYMTQGGNYNKDTAAAPLAYSLRYLCDNATCQVVMAQNYTVRTCQELREGSYSAQTVATYACRLILDYVLDGQPVHWESPLLEYPFGTVTTNKKIPAAATNIVVSAHSLWGATLVNIFRYPVTGSVPHPEEKCYKFKGVFGSNPSYEELENCDF
jgi:thiol-activated cytolysin